jgi:hypothetical protein
MAQKTSEVESTTNAASALSSAGAPEAKGKSNTCKAGLKELMEAKLISPSLRSVTFDYRNSLYTADLKEVPRYITVQNFILLKFCYQDSSIDLTDNDKVMNFRSVSAFAIYCIRRDTPSRQSCDGWMCVKYQGKPLSEIRSLLLKQKFSYFTIKEVNCHSALFRFCTRSLICVFYTFLKFSLLA